MEEQLELEFELQEAAEEIEPDNYESALGKAMAYWRSGRIIPLTLASELIADGYDVGALERCYLNA